MVPGYGAIAKVAVLGDRSRKDHEVDLTIAIHGDSVVALGSGRQRVDHTLGHDGLAVAFLDRSRSGDEGLVARSVVGLR